LPTHGRCSDHTTQNQAQQTYDGIVIHLAHLRFYEKIINLTTSQGSASLSAAHRVPPDTNQIPNYANMSFEQRRLAQDQNAMRRGGGR
jgi:hypothetical protein